MVLVPRASPAARYESQFDSALQLIMLQLAEPRDVVEDHRAKVASRGRLPNLEEIEEQTESLSKKLSSARTGTKRPDTKQTGTKRSSNCKLPSTFLRIHLLMRVMVKASEKRPSARSADVQRKGRLVFP